MYICIVPHLLHVIDLLLSVSHILYTYNIVSDVFGFISSSVVPCSFRSIFSRFVGYFRTVMICLCIKSLFLELYENKILHSSYSKYVWYVRMYECMYRIYFDLNCSPILPNRAYFGCQNIFPNDNNFEYLSLE